MTATARYEEVQVGTVLPEAEFPVHRADLVRYAGASGDFNIIHWNQRVAEAVGLPDVIAHGMLTMALAARLLTDWAGDPGAVLEYGVRFSRPVVVPDDENGAVLRVRATVADKLPERRVRIDLTVVAGGAKVLSMARAVVQLG